MEHLWVVIVIIATALQTARNAGQKKACGKTFGRFGYPGEIYLWFGGSSYLLHFSLERY